MKALGAGLEYLSGKELWDSVIHTTSSAYASRALHSIPTESHTKQEMIGDIPVNFQIRVVKNLARKSEEIKRRASQVPQAKDFNPFLPYDPQLYVGELTDQYRCLLNKFNVMDHHILMVTTKFITQLEPLNREDFLAAQLCLDAQEGLVFYNGGPEAGASITHKHLQMVPLPLCSESFPFLPLLSAAPTDKVKVTQSSLPFMHLVAASSRQTDTEARSEHNWQIYRKMASQLGLLPEDEGLSLPHNLLMTRDHLWVVPRRCERHTGLAVNALGFAGTLLVKDQQQLETLLTTGCLPLLQAVATTPGHIE
ncbi:MAG: phosphorylase [Gammaproteobacteria bacterium]|nr:MAG: phosphorylase [Gammaproteobacteria bacterium]